jgi:hypothetical protein
MTFRALTVGLQFRIANAMPESGPYVHRKG